MICGRKLSKNGVTTAGKTRWRCPNCGTSQTRNREDLTKQHQLDAFLEWALGTNPQQAIAGTHTTRTFRNHTNWCWNITPRITPPKQAPEVVEIDGFHLRQGACVLIAISHGKVIGYQWCVRESSSSWAKLLSRIPEPQVVVCDGGSGIHAALSECWPRTRVQRCLLHIQRNVRGYVTTRAKTVAGQSLWGLALRLTRVTTQEEAAEWMLQFLEWEGLYLHLTKERTYRREGVEVPAWARPGQRWWYTHARLRSGYQVFERVLRGECMFTFLEPAVSDLRVPATTNSIEGGVNARLRELLHRHRGMPIKHQRRVIEWWLYTHSTGADPARVAREYLAREWKAKERFMHPEAELEGPGDGPSYGTGLSAEEGLWLRSGWAGRG